MRTGSTASKGNRAAMEVACRRSGHWRTRRAKHSHFSSGGMRCRASTKLAGSIVGDNPEQIEERIGNAIRMGADIVEIRLDIFPEASNHLEQLIGASSVPTIATARAGWEGGFFSGSEHERIDLLRQALRCGASYIDCELEAATTLFERLTERERGKGKVILSWHDFDRMPDADELVQTHRRAVEAGADIVKIAAKANSIKDVSAVKAALDEGKQTSTPTIGLAMGEEGEVSRLLAGKFGSWLTFGSVEEGAESAPGQPTVRELNEVFDARNIEASTPTYGVIGNPVAHSRSPVLHNMALRKNCAGGVYVRYLVEDLAGFLSNSPFNQNHYSGFSVTIPHKEEALRVCDHADPLAARIGAVNTLIRDASGTLKGYNTDCDAAMDAIEAELNSRSLSGKAVVVIGAGGAGRAIAMGAKDRGASRITIANRSVEKAQALASDIGENCLGISLDELNSGSTVGDVLANSTSVGMAPNEGETPVGKGVLGGFEVVFDAVYTPLRTRLLKEAEEAGARPASGLDMFVGQAAKQFELFTGQNAPITLMRGEVLRSLGH